MCTMKYSGKPRYKGIDTVYIRVELLHKHDGTPQGTLRQRFPTPSPNDNGERSVEKVLEVNMVLQMNATFLKVLQEVLSGLLIIEPNMERRVMIRRRRPETKRVLSQSGFMCFGCHSAIYPRERERDNPNTKTKNRKEKKIYVCMKSA